MEMTNLVTNKYGVEFDHIKVKKLRIFRLSKKWLVEYRREPRWPLGLDRWWWFNDGIYVDYEDALKRVEYLSQVKYISKTQFQKVKTFEVDE
jgi:hypothetical protein